MWVAV